MAVPLDASLPAADLCELLDRADVTALVFDEVRRDVAEMAGERCPKLKHRISMKADGEKEILSLPELLEQYGGAFDCRPEPDQLCTILFTSGTHRKKQGSYADSPQPG